MCGPDDDALWTYRPTPRPETESALADLVDEWEAPGENLTWAVVPTATGAAAGMTSLYRIDPDQGQAEVAAIIYARTLQRTPGATEATYLLMRYAFDGLGYRRFEWKCDSLNEPSRQAALRLGFTYEGRFRHHLVTKGRNRDTDWFSVTTRSGRRSKLALQTWLRAGQLRRGRSAAACPVGRACKVGVMDQRISFLTLAVADLEASRRFYVDGLGWRPTSRSRTTW